MPRYFPRLLLAVLMIPMTGASGAESSNSPASTGKEMSGENKDSLSGQLKRAALSVAMERAKAFLDVSSNGEASTLLDEIAKASLENADKMLSPGGETNSVSALRPPRTPVRNPYLDRMVSGAMKEMKSPDISWPKEKPDSKAFDIAPIGMNPRTLGIKMQGWLWLLVNPASPLRGNPEVLARFLRIAHAYADALDVEGNSYLEACKKTIPPDITQDFNGVFDRYALTPASCALREFSQLYPNLLLPSQKATWDRAMHTAGNIVMNRKDIREGTYAVADLQQAAEWINFGLYLHDDSYLSRAKPLIEAQEKNIYPDGGIAANDHQNDAHVLHDFTTDQMAALYEVTQDPRLLELLRKTEWYGPVSSGKMGEFWTVACWKDLWNRADAVAGGEPVAAVTGNPYVRGMLDKALQESQPPGRWAENRCDVDWYRDDVKPLPLPDNYTIIDRNINGPRAWHGRFSYAATLRPIPPTEPGHGTLMGAQVLSPDEKLGQLLMGVCPRIRLKEAILNPDGRPVRQAYAWPTSGLQSALVMGRDFSALSGSYLLHQYQASSKGPDVDWQGRQLWLGLPDRIIGLVEVEAIKEGATAWNVEGILRLGTGGTIYGKPTLLESQGEGVYHYGDLSISLLSHNFAAIKSREVPFRVANAPVTELTLLDEKGASDPKTVSQYALGTRHWFLVEIRPSWVKEAATAHRLEKPTGVLGLEATVGKKTFVLMDNPGSTELKLKVPAAQGEGSQVLFTSSGGDPETNVPATISLKPRELAVLVTSPDAEDHQRGFSSYREMVNHRWGYSAGGTPSTSRVAQEPCATGHSTP